MEITGIVHRDKIYEKQPEGTSRYAHNIVITKDSKIQNEDGIRLSTEINYPYDVGEIVEVDINTIAIFPLGNTDGLKKEVYIFEKDKAVNKIEIAIAVTPETFSATTFRNYLEERIIVFIDKENILRVINIDTPIVEYLVDNVDKLTRLTSELDAIETVNVNRVKGGNLKTGRYFISYGLEVEEDNPIKWTTPIGPYVVANYNLDENTSHVGNVDSISDFALEISFNPKSESFKGVNVAVISDIDGTLSADIVYKSKAGGAWSQQTFRYTGNEVIENIAVNEILIPKQHINKAKAITQIQDSLIISGNESIDHSQFDALQLVANDVEVHFKVSELYTKDIRDQYDYKDDLVVDSLYGSDNNSSFMPDEVYALYMNIKFIDGIERAYHIPGREHLACNITVPEAGVDSAQFDDTAVPQAILDYEDVVNNVYFTEIPRDAKLFQLYNTAELLSNDNGATYYNNNSGSGFIPGYWENADEIYPDDDRFGTLKGHNVRHHRSPTYKQCYEVNDSISFKINANFRNIIIPSNLKPYIAGIYFSAAKRTTTNSLISGITPLIPHDEMFAKNGSGIFEAQFINGKQIRLYDYNLNTNLLSPTADYLKPIYNHIFDYGNADQEHDLWNYRAKRKANATYNFNMYSQADIRFIQIKEKFYMPEGNAATEPPNIYEDVANNKIINRENCLFVNFNNLRYVRFKDDSLPNKLLKQVAILYNWNTNVYTNFAKQDTFIISELTPDIEIGVYDSLGGDVFNGNEFKKIIYEPETGDGVGDYVVSWIGFSPILQQSRVKDISGDKDVTETYNKSCTPINDLHTPIIFGNDLKDKNIFKFPYRTYKSQVQATESDRLGIRNILANSYTDCPQNKGSITNVIGKDDALFVQTENTTWLYKVKDILKTDELTAYLGSSDIFDIKPKELIINKLGLGGNAHINSHLISRDGILYPDANSGEFFLVMDDIKYLAQKGLTKDIKRYLDNAKLIKSAYDEDLNRFIISIIGKTTNDPNVVLSYYPYKDGWCSDHSYTGVIPFNFGEKLHLANIDVNATGNKIYTFDPLTPSLNIKDGAPADSFIDIVVGLPDEVPAKINSIYFRTICESLLDFNNLYLKDHTIDELLIYTRSKCTGIINIKDRLSDRMTANSIISLKHGAWRFNDIKDMIVHYVKNTAGNTDIGELVDRPYFLNELTGEYNPTILSSDAGGTRHSIPYYEQTPFVESYVVVRFIIKTNNKRKVSISDIALSLNQLNL